MEAVSYLIINICTLAFNAIGILFMKNLKEYSNNTSDVNLSKSSDNHESKDVSASDEKTEEDELETVSKSEPEVIEADLSTENKDEIKAETEVDKQEDTSVTDSSETKDVQLLDSSDGEVGKSLIKRIIGDNMVFVFAMLILNMFLGNFLVLIYDNHIVTDVKLMLMVVSLWPIALIDYREKIIPNSILKVLICFRVVLLIPELICLDNPVRLLLAAVIAAVVMLVACIAVAFLMKDSIGMGDVKLFIVMALYLGVDGIGYAVFCALVVSFFIALYLLCSKKASRKDSIPFAPAILIGTFLSVFLTGI
ncbi:MAG: hypothetical protein E7258_05985 [Lachnospiraceae bacterium]|nr:hypothetical protein [Lachnospiraceae bacterium]